MQEEYTSENYLSLLKTIAKMPHYSPNNLILINMQMPEASMCMGFHGWKSLGYTVRRGEKAIRILAPAFYKQEVEKVNEDGTVEKMQVERERYKVVSTFDVSQVVSIKTGESYPEITPELTDPVADYYCWYSAIETMSPVPVRWDEIRGGVKGYYSEVGKEIVLSNKIRGKELQTLKTLTHEVAHARLHTGNSDIDRATKEIQAESIGFVVTSALNIGDTSAYSFNYVQSWSSGKDIKELKASLDVIRKEAIIMIDGISQKLNPTLKVDTPKLHSPAIQMAM